MKLYYVPGACSLVPHIALCEAGLSFTTVALDPKTHKLPDGSDFYAINPLGYIPVLELDDGTCLREVTAIVQYIADQAPQRKLAPANGSIARYQLQAWLNFIATELHKNFGPLFNPAMPEAAKASTKERLLSRLQWVDSQLAGQTWLMGEDFSVADCYLFTVTNWPAKLGIDIGHLTHVKAFRERAAARPGVHKAMQAEGLLK